MGLTLGSLFTGIGGIDLGFEWAGISTVWQVEHDPWLQHLLAGHWPEVPRFGDVRTVDPSELGAADIVAGGFPCQPNSNAGRQAGRDDPRWLWPHFARVLGGIRPTYAVIENVPGLRHVNGGAALGDILADLAASGFDAWWDGLSAANVGAPHRRDRVWIIARRADVAHPEIEPEWPRLRASQPAPVGGRRSGNGGGPHDAADPDRAGLERLPRHDVSPAGWSSPVRSVAPGGVRGAAGSVWAAEPEVGRVADGIPRRVDRLRALGNAVVPQVAAAIGSMIVADWAAQQR